MQRFAVILAVGLLAASVSAAEERAELDAFLRAHIRQEKIPGMVVGIMDGDKQWLRAYGLADIENQTAMTVDASFRLASVTKTMTAVAILQLAEQGKLDLDAEVQTYVPYFPRKKWPITIRQLLGHLAGIPHYVNRATEQHIKEHKTTREAIAIFENFDLVAEPGSRFSYSSYGYNLLGAVIEQVAGQPYEDYMRDRIWAPLGMSSTRMDDPVAIIPRRVRGYRLISGEIANSEFIDISSRFAAGGLRTTVPDMLRFGRGLIDGKLIGMKSLEMLWTPMQTASGELTDYGMGCFVHPVPGFLDTNGRFAISNNGGQQETRTFLMMFPSRKIVFATAMNAEVDTGASELYHIAQSIFGEPFDFVPTAAATADRVALAAMQSVFTLGLADREAHSVPPPGRASLAEARRYFASILDDAAHGVSEKELLVRIAAGRQPRTGAPLVVLGRSMAEKLEGDYTSKGAALFFRDAGELPKWLAPRIARYARDWTRSTPPEVRTLAIGIDSDVDSIARTLRSHLTGATIVPNLAPQLAGVTESWAVALDPRASTAADLAVELFPGAAEAQRAKAIARVAAGDVAGARDALARAAADDTAPDQLNRTAYAFARTGHVDRGLTLLVVATEVFPRVANLFDSLGELSALAGQRDAAIAAYERAIAIDPNMKSSRDALAKLRGK